MLLRIKKIMKHENINLNLPKACLNQDIIFTDEEIRIVEEEMNTINAAREEQVQRELEQSQAETLAIPAPC
jgi:hypothetical protein